MGAAALAAGTAIVEEAPFPDRFQDARQGVMNDAIPVTRGADQARFRFADLEGVTGARLVGFGPQFLLQTDQLVFPFAVEFQDARLPALAPCRVLRRPQQVGKRRQWFPQMTDPPCHYSPVHYRARLCAAPASRAGYSELGTGPFNLLFPSSNGKNWKNGSIVSPGGTQAHRIVAVGRAIEATVGRANVVRPIDERRAPKDAV